MVMTFYQRLVRHGWRSARTYALCNVINLWLRARNRWHWRHRVECPCCGWRGHDFLPVDCGKFMVLHGECPHCRGHERHRMLTLYLQRRDRDLIEGRGVVLHCAPERYVRDLLLRNPNLFIIGMDFEMYMAKRFPPPAIVADIQRLGIADNSIDLIFCLHVFEHVPDDRKGLAELARVLKPGGVAYVMVPFILELNATVEYGRPDPFMFDHLRAYSPKDFEPRLAPFSYEKITRHDFLTAEEVRRYRIPEKEVLFRCVKKSIG